MWNDSPSVEDSIDLGAVGIPCNSSLAVAEAMERGLKRREKNGLEVAIMGPVCR
jgi:hypothetical protein